MGNSSKTRHGRALGAIVLAGSLSLAGGCDWIETTTSNPNQVPEAAIDQLFTGSQVATYFLAEGEGTRAASIWLQQMAGLGQQFAGWDVYTIFEDDAGTDWATVYTGGGLPDLDRAIALAEEAGRMPYAGILKIHKAYLVGTAASMFGDIPYSEAATDVETPVLDPQEEVYAAIQDLLSEAIEDLQGQGAGPGPLDLNFGGDVAAWTRVAHTLKARYYLHWVEAQQQGLASAQTACGGNCIELARQQALQGIQTAAGTWHTVHSTKSTEANMWYQFMSERAGYMGAGALGVDLLKERDDPRLPIYYSTASGTLAGQYVGSPPGTNLPNDPGADASLLSESGYGAPDWSTPIVSCAENQFILAETSYYLGDIPAAQAALVRGVECEEARLGVTDIPVQENATGEALLEEIIRQKYLALFLNFEAFNDYKRTCLPELYPFAPGEADLADMPRRFFYAQTERQSNPNVPAPGSQPEANENDPVGCS